MDTMPGNDPMEKPEPLDGLDPADLLRQGVAEDTMIDETSSAFQPPPIQELARLFPLPDPAMVEEELAVLLGAFG